MSNFEYIKDEFPEFYELVVNAESYLYKDSRAAAMYIRFTLEAAVKWLFANDPTLFQPYHPKGLVT
jgi:type I restriction enzyme R subunit